MPLISLHKSMHLYNTIHTVQLQNKLAVINTPKQQFLPAQEVLSHCIGLKTTQPK